MHVLSCAGTIALGQEMVEAKGRQATLWQGWLGNIERDCNVTTLETCTQALRVS